MTIVIPYKQEVLNGLELKYALRSIEKNLSGWDKVLIVGYPPNWFKYIPDEQMALMMNDFDGRKEYSCYQKLLAACEDSAVSENFVYWNDDHWLLKPLDVSEIKNWHNGPLEDEIKKPHTARWRQTAIATEASLFSGGMGTLNFDIHVPCIFNKRIFESLFKLQREEICIKSHYKNYVHGNEEFMEDCNLSSQLTYEQIKKEIEGKLFCSSKQGITKEYFRVLEELFPEPSKFER